MTIQINSDLAAALQVRATQEGIPPEEVAVKVLSDQLLPRKLPFEPRDEWERRLLEMGGNYGAGLTNEQLSREQMYD